MLKLPEVAQRLGVSQDTARRYVKAGRIPSTFIGNAYRVKEEDLEAFIQDSEVQGRKPKVTEEPIMGQLTAVYEPGENGWIVVTCPEVPGAISQGRTMEEARNMIREAVELVLEANRELAEEELVGHEGVIREPLQA